MGCIFCEMGRCLTHIVREYDYEEDRARRNRRELSEEVSLSEPRLIFDIRQSSGRSPDLSSRSGLLGLGLGFIPSFDTRPLQRPLITEPWEAENARTLALEWRQRAEDERLRGEATAILDEIADTVRGIRAGLRDVADMFSKIGQHQQKVNDYQELNTTRKEMDVAVTLRIFRVGLRLRQIRTNISTILKTRRLTPWHHVAAARKLAAFLLPAEERYNTVSGAILEVYLKVKPVDTSSSQKQRAITFNSDRKPADLVAVLPMSCGNALRLANDMINHPLDGNTGFVVGGQTVYHSSKGSARAGSTRGTAFWTVTNSRGTLVAMGEHIGNSSDTYKITWLATGRQVISTTAKRVQLQNQKMRLA